MLWGLSLKSAAACPHFARGAFAGFARLLAHWSLPPICPALLGLIALLDVLQLPWLPLWPLVVLALPWGQLEMA